jgi:hypothetical protein
MKSVPLIVIIAILAGILGWIISRPSSPNAGDMARLENELKEAKAAINRLSSLESTAMVQAPQLSQPPLGATPPSEVLAPGGQVVPGGGTSEMKFAGATPREMIAQQSEAQVQMIYGDLFSSLQLNSEEQAKLQGLIGERTRSRSELDIQMLNSSVSADQKSKLSADFVVAQKASDEAIRALLGSDENYQKFQQQEDTQAERTQLRMLGGLSHFESAGEPLTPQQQDQLVNAMATARKSANPAQPSLHGGGTVDERINAALMSHDQTTTATTQKAAEFLSPAQLDAFNKMQKSARTNLEMSLRMISSMQVKH